jgi:hypothetical protein
MMHLTTFGHKRGKYSQTMKIPYPGKSQINHKGRIQGGLKEFSGHASKRNGSI